MKTTHMAVLSVMVLAAVVLGGCDRGMKVTFINNTPNPIGVTYNTLGLEGDFQVQSNMGDIDPGKKKTARIKYTEEASQSERQLSITVDGGTLKQTTALVAIPKKPYTYKKLTVNIGDGPDVTHDITVTDGDGNKVDTK